MNKITKATILLAVLLLLRITIVPHASDAATVELTANIRATVDQIATAADSKLKSKLSADYTSLVILQERDTDWELKLKAIRYKNEEVESILRIQMKEIDADKISKLEAEVKRTKEKYAPLFTSYDIAKGKMEAAKVLKNKDLNKILKMQVDGIKVAVELAKQDIKNKETALKEAKTKKNETTKKIRDTLALAKPIQARIKAEKSAVTVLKKSITTTWSSFKQILKKNSPNETARTLDTLVDLSKRIEQHKQKQHHLEIEISNVIAKAKGLLR